MIFVKLGGNIMKYVLIVVVVMVFGVIMVLVDLVYGIW